MEKEIRIAEGLSLPMNAVTQTFAQIGRKGAGKTYLASMIAEQMLEAKAQVIVIDPIGNWWGLRVDADGKSKGKDIYVMGGLHADVSLSPESGKEIAKILTEKNISVVLDVSGFRKNQRKKFITDFAEEFYHLKKAKPSAVHIFLEEAQKFVPQRVMRDDARMLGAWEDIVRLGRNCGIGCSLISQRPQSVNKEVLSQVECLCVLQVTGLHERKALEEWIQEAGEDRKIIGELPSLATGHGYIWSPAWLRIFKRVKFNKKTTMDTSSTPELGKATKVAKLSKMDVKKLQEVINEVTEKTQEELKTTNDYKNKIVELKRDLRQAQISQPKPLIEVNEKGLERARIEGKKFADNEWGVKFQEMQHNNRNIIKQLQKNEDFIRKFITSGSNLIGTTIELPKPVAIPKPIPILKLPEPVKVVYAEPVTRISMDIPDGEIQLGLCAKKLYSFLAHKSERKFTRPQIGAATGYRVTSGGFKNAISQLRQAGLIEGTSELQAKIVDEGLMGNFDFSIQAIVNGLGKCEREIFEVLMENPNREFEYEELAAETPSNYSPTSGGYKNSLSRLKTLGLIHKDGTIKLHEDMLEII